MNVPAAPRQIRAVTFDAGGTLLTPSPSVGAVYAATARAAGFGEFAADELEARFRAAWQAREGFDYSAAAWAELVRKTFAELTPAAGDARLFAALWRRFAEAGAWRVYPDVPPCLAALRARGLRLAVVSNWDERLPPLLHCTGLAAEFEFILPSVECAAPKPAPEIFHRAARQLGLPPHAVLHVGDSRREDVGGARAAGFAALLLKRDPAPAAGPDILSSLAELPQWLEPA